MCKISNQEEVMLGDVLSKVLNDEAFHDITLLGKDGIKVRANRCILAARSDVFQRMLLGSFSEARSEEVKLEYEGCVLKAVVEYIHTDQPQLLEAAHSPLQLHPEEFQPLFSLAAAAVFFNLPSLAQQVQHLISTLLDELPDASFVLLEACKRQGPAVPDDLVELVVSHASSSVSLVGDAEAVACLSQDTVEEILKNKGTAMSECQLFQLLACWANQSPSDRLLVAKDLAQHLQLQWISPELLSSVVETSGFVTTEQLLGAYKKHALQKDKLNVEEAPRAPIWKNTLTRDCLFESRRKHKLSWGFLKCPMIASGSYQWTLEQVGDSCGILACCGVALKGEIPMNNDCYASKGVWTFGSDGRMTNNGSIDLRFLHNRPFEVGDKITLTLTLQPEKDESDGVVATLAGWILREETREKYGLREINIMRDSVDGDPVGFVPVVSLYGSGGFRLLNFQKVA